MIQMRYRVTMEIATNDIHISDDRDIANIHSSFMYVSYWCI